MDEVSVEWDARKAAANLQKHGVDFADAVAVPEDDDAITVQDAVHLGERRYVTLGMDALGRPWSSTPGAETMSA